MGRVINAASNAMLRSLLLDIGGYDEELPAYEDWDLFASILERGYRGEVIPEFSILYRLRPAYIMHSIDPKRHHLLRGACWPSTPAWGGRIRHAPAAGRQRCGGDCAETYPVDTRVTLVATPADGSIFVGWDGPWCLLHGLLHRHVDRGKAS